MNTKFYVIILVAMTLVVPAYAHDIGDPNHAIDDLKVQIAELQGKLQILQQPSISFAPSLTGTVTPCIAPGRRLALGMRDGEVTKLQSFLASQGDDVYPEKLVTGYYGQLTIRAVGRFQLKNKIVVTADSAVGYGIVGPRTLTAITNICKQGSTFEVVPSLFTLKQGESVTLNYQQMKIYLDTVGGIYCITTPCEQPVVITVSTPGGCGPNADPRCLGPPAFSSTYTLHEGETVRALGVIIKLISIDIANSSARFSVKSASSAQTIKIETSPDKNIEASGQKIIVKLTLGTPLFVYFNASGGILPYTWWVSNGLLPQGLTFTKGADAIAPGCGAPGQACPPPIPSTTAALSGTPGTSGTYMFDINVKDSNNSTGSLTVEIRVF